MGAGVGASANKTAAVVVDPTIRRAANPFTTRFRIETPEKEGRLAHGKAPNAEDVIGRVASPSNFSPRDRSFLDSLRVGC